MLFSPTGVRRLKRGTTQRVKLLLPGIQQATNGEASVPARQSGERKVQARAASSPFASPRSGKEYPADILGENRAANRFARPNTRGIHEGGYEILMLPTGIFFRRLSKPAWCEARQLHRSSSRHRTISSSGTAAELRKTNRIGNSGRFNDHRGGLTFRLGGVLQTRLQRQGATLQTSEIKSASQYMPNLPFDTRGGCCPMNSTLSDHSH